MEDTFLGIEAGVGAVKACAFSLGGDVLGKAQMPVHLTTPRQAWAEIELEQYWQNVLLACREATRDAGRIAGIGVTTACPATVFFDRNFRPLRPGILYLDRRCDNHVRRFADELGGVDSLFRVVGNVPFSSTCSFGNLPWTRECEPAIWKATRHVGMLSTFLVHRLTGRFVLDRTQASFSGAFSVPDPDAGWRLDLVEAWGAKRGMLPRLGLSHEKAGRLTAEAAGWLGVEPGVPVAFGAGNTAASALAVGLRGAGEAVETTGTSGVVSFCIDRPDFNPAFMNRCHIFPNRWLAQGAMSTLGGALGWLKNKIWPEIVSIAELEQMAAESPAGANGLIFLPYLAGERSPIWDADARGVWVGMRLDTTRADMIRAVFEGAAYGLKHMLEIARLQWGKTPSSILSVGGGSRSRFWSQIKREILGVEYHTADRPDAAAWGAAILGAVAAGELSGIDDERINFLHPSKPKQTATMSQRMRQNDQRRKEAYERAFAVYKEVYPSLKNVMHALAGNVGDIPCQ